MPSEVSIARDQNVADPEAEAHERRVEEELKAQFLDLRRQARGYFNVVKGRRGAYSEAYWEEVFRRAISSTDFERWAEMSMLWVAMCIAAGVALGNLPQGTPAPANVSHLIPTAA